MLIIPSGLDTCFSQTVAPARSKALSSEAEINENEQDAASISLISNFDRCFAQKIYFQISASLSVF